MSAGSEAGVGAVEEKQTEALPASLSAPSDRLKASYIYLDASVYRALRFDWQGRWLKALADLARRGLIRVVVTDITKREVAALMRESWADANRSVQKAAIMLGQLGLDGMVKQVGDEAAAAAKMQAAFEWWLRSASAWTCKYDPDLPGVLDAYFHGQPPFGEGRKKSEFPDAIVVSMLRAWCSTTKQSVYVVSQDGDLKACCTDGSPLIYASSVAEVLSHGTATVRVHDAVVAAVRESEWFSDQIAESLAHAHVRVEAGYQHGSKTDVDVHGATLEELAVDDVYVEEFDGTEMRCAVWLTLRLRLRVSVEREAIQYGRDEWEPGAYYISWVTVSTSASASATASLAADGSVTLTEAGLDQTIEVGWSDVEAQID